MKVAKVKGIKAGEHPELTEYKIKLDNLDINIRKGEEALAKSCYTVYNSLNEFESNILQSKNIWAIYSFEQAVYDRYKNVKQRYEDIVCGFLQYYDREVRN